MRNLSSHGRSRARWMMPALPGFVLGSALQLQQPALFNWQAYAALLVVGLAAFLWMTARPGVSASQWIVAAALCAIAGFGLTGWRAAQFQSQALDPALEGRDILLTGVVAAMPQVNEAGTRFRFRVESARLDGVPVRAPGYVYLGWYTNGGTAAGEEAPEPQRQPEMLAAGERWQMPVRLKAPHGNRNPHGFDYELWLWEQGLQATGYVRAGRGDAAARRLGQTNAHPVELARQRVRDRIFEQVPERKVAGVIAALVVGDQNAIDGGGQKSCSRAFLRNSLILLTFALT